MLPPSPGVDVESGSWVRVGVAMGFVGTGGSVGWLGGRVGVEAGFLGVATGGVGWLWGRVAVVTGVGETVVVTSAVGSAEGAGGEPAPCAMSGTVSEFDEVVLPKLWLDGVAPAPVWPAPDKSEG